MKENPKIELNNGFYVELIQRNYVLRWVHREKDNKTDEEKDVDSLIGYYGDMESLMKRYFDKCQENALKDSMLDTITMKAYAEIVVESNKKAVDGIKEVLSKYPFAPYLKGNADDNS